MSRNTSPEQLANLAPQFNKRKHPKYFVSTDMPIGAPGVYVTIADVHNGKGPLFIRINGGVTVTIDPPTSIGGLAVLGVTDGTANITATIPIEALAGWLHWTAQP